MTRNMDTIKFESRAEVRELMEMVDIYIKQNPQQKQNKNLERFFNLLDVMDMEW